MIDVAVILNPASGSAAGDGTPERITELFAAHGRSVTILAATPGRPIGEQARSAAEQGCRLAVASGGDGTVNVVAGAILGIALGALTAAAPGPRVGAAIGVAAGLVAWSGLMAASLAGGGFDTDKLKDRFWPSRTIEVTKETIEWARERMPLKRTS